MKVSTYKTAFGGMKVVKDLIQGSDDWFRQRRGRPTASRFGDIVTPAKGDLSKSATAYAQELIADCIVTDMPPDFSGSRFTDRGTEWEPAARTAFAEHTGLEVEEVGFVTREDNEYIGASPDGLIWDAVNLEYTAGLECKVLSPKKHVAVIANGVLPDEHKAQVHGSLYVTGLPEWHFWAYCPGMNPFHCITRPDDYTAKVGAAVEQFLIDYIALRKQLIPKLKITPTKTP